MFTKGDFVIWAEHIEEEIRLTDKFEQYPIFNVAVALLIKACGKQDLHFDILDLFIENSSVYSEYALTWDNFYDKYIKEENHD